MNDNMTLLLQKLDSVVVFRNISDGDVISSLRRLLSSREDRRRVRLYSDFVSALFSYSTCLGEYLSDALARDENIYVTRRAEGVEIPPTLRYCVESELSVFSELSTLTPEELWSFVGASGYLPRFDTEKHDFVSEYEERMKNVSVLGYGIYASSVMFHWRNGNIVPVATPDATDVSHLYCYESERQKLIDNTLSFLEGKPAANALLCGDAGTGKSSSIKAVTNLFAPRGLRLVELRKEDIRDIPAIMGVLRKNPLKFILFINDLSFSSDDDNFSALKAILEGSASVQSPNTIIYVTSNRRHLVKESFSDRDGDDVHRNDTMEELLSMSERFGLVILFVKPSKKTYLEIVHNIFMERGMPEPDEKLDVEACAFALRKGGFTPRAAEQFADEKFARG
ncbi:MAG: ATP-binding protein [Firmicutes bacterium]|nr:ATP-binding protein [Bacillota bacterium]